MFQLAMAPPTIASVPVQGRGKGPPGSDEQGGPGCLNCCGDARKVALALCEGDQTCREDARDDYQDCKQSCQPEGCCVFAGDFKDSFQGLDEGQCLGL